MRGVQRNYGVCLCLWLSVGLCLTLSAQDSTRYRLDTVAFRAGECLQLRSRIICFKRDTVLMLSDTLGYSIVPEGAYLRNKHFHDSLEHRLHRNKLASWLYQVMFTRTPEGFNTDNRQNQVSENPFARYKGKIIRHIYLKKLPPFGTSITDTLNFEPTPFERLGNRLHLSTADRILRQNLLIKEGNPVNTILLADAERVLRRLPYLQDARIYLRQDKKDKNIVDAVVVTKDLWSIGGQVSLNGLEEYTVGVSDNNILGQGQRFGADVFLAVDKPVKWGYGLHHTIENVKGSFIRSQVDVVKKYQNELLNLQLTRTFFTPDIKYAGSLQLARIFEGIGVYRVRSDSAETPVLNTYQIGDVWVGRSTRLQSEDEEAQKAALRTNLVTSARLLTKMFLDRPFVSADSNQFFENYTLGLASIGISRRSYYKSGLIFGFGRTEDIPVGKLISLTAGYKRGEFSNALYTGFSARRAWLIRRKGYLQSEFNIGSFWQHGLSQQGVVQWRLSTFSPLVHWKDYKGRFFFQANYVKGFNRLSTESISIGDRSGIRGLSGNFLRGTEKLVFNVDNYIFTNAYLYGFRFVINPFVDVGWIATDRNLLSRDNFYTGIGAGIKLRNENLFISTIVLRLAYYPITPSGVFPGSFALSDESRIDFLDFDSKAPNLIVYQ